MIDDTEFSECVLQIDTREKSQRRIERISKFWKSKGGMVERAGLPLGDYLITGSFRGKEIDLLIEYKTLVDFSGSYEDLPRKLFEAGKTHRFISLFIEEGDVALSFTEHGSFIKNPGVKDGTADILNYYSYKNFIDSLSQDGIHCRVFRHESFFEEDLYSLLIHLIKDCHTGLHIKGNDYETQFLNLLCKIDGIGGVRAHQINSVIPNLEKLVELSYHDGVFEKILGKISGKKLRLFLSNGSRKEQCLKNYNTMFEHSNVGHKSEEVILSSSGSDNPGSSKESGILRSGNLIEPPIPPLLQSVKPLEVSRKQTQEVIAMLPPAPPITKIVTSLTDSIVDFCYEKPRSDTEIMNWFQMKGFEMPEIHKKLIQLTKNKKLHKYKQSNTVYFTYTGVRADTEMDIGV